MRDKSITRHASVRELEIDNAMRTAARFAGLGKIDKAVPIYQRILSSDPNHAGAQAKLAELAFATNAFDIAVGLAQRAIAREPNGPYALGATLLLGQTLQILKRPADAAGAYRRAIALDPTNAEAHAGLGTALLDLGDRDAAIKSFRTALTHNPSHPRAAFMESAIGQARTDTGYVRDLFDNYASYFDAHLTGKLGYRLPEDMRKAVEKAAPGRRFAAALDLGCGTGLVAERFAGLYGAIDGIDLSPKMIEAARTKGLYRTLSTGDLTEILATTPGPYDLVIAADTMIYVGDVEPSLARLGTIMPPGGLFALSIELMEGDGFAMQASARYAHSKAYVERLVVRHGFVLLGFTDVPVRLENNLPLPGSIALLSRPG
ncbi:tetratricopeptide repeat protein [Devosia sp.]|jgi:predicted TPR repeat methyltransferase|uniref:tetratricopeptide repeat protein n=1 Tax=Devosia sp. TaxID=1871048 RepID=UPI0037BE61EA